MPLPLLFIFAALGTGAIGVAKAVNASSKISEANDTNARAQSIVVEAKEKLEKERKKCKSSLKKLGDTKVNILGSSINHFVKSYGKLKNINFQDSKGLKEMNRLHIDSKDFEELKQMGGFATSVLSGVASGVTGGAITAFGAYSAAGIFASASTGTAIATLNGIAATNATLAFFGGGSIAAGGLGIAGGTMVLGGLIAGPALAIMGFIIGAKASKARDEAYSNLAKANKFASETDVASDMCNAISDKCKLFIKLLKKLDEYFSPLIFTIDEAIEEHGTDFRLFNKEQQNATAAAASLAKAIKTVLDTPILDEQGNLTDEANKVLDRIRPQNFAK